MLSCQSKLTTKTRPAKQGKSHADLIFGVAEVKSTSTSGMMGDTSRCLSDAVHCWYPETLQMRRLLFAMKWRDYNVNPS